MDAFFPAFVAALLAEIGDKTQWLALALALHFRKAVPVLAGIALAALANAAIAASGGAWLAPYLNPEARMLMLALALLFAGGAALVPQAAPDPALAGRLGAFPASFIAFLALELGDKTQFLTFAIALRAGDVWLAMAGATLGVVVASLVTVLIGREMKRPHVLALRRCIAALFLVTGCWTAIGALRLI